MMRHVSIEALDKRFRGFLKPHAWTLCVGAGTAIGILPGWPDLCRRLVNETFNMGLDDQGFIDLVRHTSWGFEAWIQASLNRHLAAGKDADEFLQLLEAILYDGLRDRAAKESITKQVFQSFRNPHFLNQDELEDVLAFFQRNYPQASAPSLAEFLPRPNVIELRPRCIITLNYDVILDALLRMHEIRRHVQRVGFYQFPPEGFRGVTSPLTKWGQRVPIFHLHGSLTPRPPGPRPQVVPHDARHIIVGPEMTYSQPAGTTTSWGQSTFLHHAVSDNVVFVGHSMADPNIRRWLALSSQTHALDIASGKRFRAPLTFGSPSAL